MPTGELSKMFRVHCLPAATGKVSVTNSTGRFITFEGGEGVGKSTQIHRLANVLRRRGHDVLVTREPGGSRGAEAVRHVLLSGAAGIEHRPAPALGAHTAEVMSEIGLNSNTFSRLARGGAFGEQDTSSMKKSG